MYTTTFKLIQYNRNGDILIPFEYEYIGKLYEENQFMLVKDKQYYVYNPTNKKTYGPYNNQISQYSEKFIVTNEGSYLNKDDK